MLTPTDILWLVGYPALPAAVAMLATQPWRRGRDLGGWGAAIAIAGGFAIAFAHEYDLPPFPPTSAQQWLFFLGAPVVLVAAAMAFVRSKWFAIAAPALILAATPYLLLRRVWFVEPRVLWTWIGGGAVAMVAWWAAMEPLARRSRGGSLPLLVAIVIGVAGLAIINAGSKTLGEATGSVAIPLTVVALAAWWSRGSVLPRGGTVAVAVLLLGLLLCAYFFAPACSRRDMLLLALAPLAAWAGELPGLGKPDSWTRLAVRTVAVLAVVALPAVTAITGLQATLDEQAESYSY